MSKPLLPDRRIAYTVLRIAFGINMVMHGVNRIIGGVDGFAGKVTHDFAALHLPPFLVTPYATSLPFAELAIGVAILFGVLLRPVLIAGGALIGSLTFGTALQGDWNVVGVQLLYSVVYYLLLVHRGDDAWSIDVWLASRRASFPSRTTPLV